MADFNDASDPQLGAACNRLAAFCEALPAGAIVDRSSGLSEPDLVLILRRLHATRLDGKPTDEAPPRAKQPVARAGVPITAKKA